MGLTLEGGVSALTVFLQGILSFFSPCVLPLVPLYIGYLAGGAKTTDADGRLVYRRGKVMLNTLFFIIGVSFAFFLLGFGVTALGKFFAGNRMWFARVGGILVVLFGLYQLFGEGAGFLGRERRLPFRLDKLAMNPLVALVFGFTFSFAWTPCVGPALASVLLIASSAKSSATGFVLIGVYTLGFVLPFLAVGLFTGTLLDLFKKHNNVVRYTVKAGGVLLVLMGLMMFTGTMNGVTNYLSSITGGVGSSQSAPKEPAPQDSAPAPDASAEPEPSDTEPPAEEQPDTTAPDFTLTDQYGNEHTLSDYKGKVVFLNFWATWCGWCKKEMPDIEQLYLDHGENTGDVIILGVAAPDAGDSPESEIKQFLDDGGYTYPTLMDRDGSVFAMYGASSLPTTFMIDAAGNAYGYVPGMLEREQMDSIIEQTQASAAE